MTYRNFRYIAIVVTSTICGTILSHFFFPCLIPYKTIAIKATHFVITVEENTLIVSINEEEQFRYTPQDIAKDSYSIGFFYSPPSTVSGKSELSDLQIDY